MSPESVLDPKGDVSCAGQHPESTEISITLLVSNSSCPQIYSYLFHQRIRKPYKSTVNGTDITTPNSVRKLQGGKTKAVHVLHGA